VIESRASRVVTALGLAMFGAMVIQPIMLEGLFQYPTLSALSLSTLPTRLTGEAAGLCSLLGTIGSSIGIVIITTFYTRDSQSAWNALSGFFNEYNPALWAYVHALGSASVDGATAQQLAFELDRQARMVAIVDVYWLITFSFLLMLPRVWLLKKCDAPQGEDEMSVME
jgi:DHA2 family multidrug resistance protein